MAFEGSGACDCSGRNSAVYVGPYVRGTTIGEAHLAAGRIVSDVRLGVDADVDVVAVHVILKDTSVFAPADTGAGAGLSP